jgi:hypothetical protein
LEEFDFFEEVCLTSLYATKAVKFAAVVDSNGTMLTGKFRKISINEFCTKMAASSKWTGRGYSFYHTYLIPALDNKDWSSNKSHLEVTEIASQDEDNNSSRLLLAITPLTQSNDKFLCIYMEMTPQASNQHEQIMSRICESI